MTAGFGAFGKMPAVGDFFRLNPPAGFVAVWDDWLQRALLTGRAGLGAEWDGHYMSAPIWRFSLSAGLAGTHKVIGVAMPSVDRVGRQFPLTLMAAVPTPDPAPLDHFGAGPVFARLEELALDCLEDGMSRDRLAERLAVLAPPISCRCSLSLGRGGLMMTGTGDGLLPRLASELVAGRYRRPSLWSAMVDDTHRLLVRDGLPEGGDMQALFDLDAPAWRQEPAP